MEIGRVLTEVKQIKFKSSDGKTALISTADLPDTVETHVPL